MRREPETIVEMARFVVVACEVVAFCAVKFCKVEEPEMERLPPKRVPEAVKAVEDA